METLHIKTVNFMIRYVYRNRWQQQIYNINFEMISACLMFHEMVITRIFYNLFLQSWQDGFNSPMSDNRYVLYCMRWEATSCI